MLPLHPLDVATVAVLAFVGLRLATVAGRAVRPPLRHQVLSLWRGIRLRHVVPVPFVLAAVATTAYLLLGVPGLDVGWWSAIGGQGNPVTGGTDRTAGTSLEVLLPLVFVVLLVPGLPLFAAAEEQRFRLGAEGWSTLRRVLQGVAFGAVHALIGIPIGVALALSIGGWWFTAVYLWGFRRGGRTSALREATLAHLAYNASVLALLVASVALTASGTG
ncbi:MAG: hypothetical protein KY447_01545 [Actinobacteria bacterium]|nr:hypothetical protein [Actinomycetota bacterium]MBW3641581.1 hypothetical protein [Actinomycetota bacterium]